MTVGNELWIKSPLVLLMALFPISVLLFLGKPLLLGFVPLGIFSLYRYMLVKQKKRHRPLLISLEAQDQKEKFEIELNNLLLITLIDNDTWVYYLNNHHLYKKSLHGSLKYFESQLKNTPVRRCHAAYLINLSQISFVDGNTEGIKIYLRQYDEAVPVSKKYKGTISSALQALNDQVLEKI